MIRKPKDNDSPLFKYFESNWEKVVFWGSIIGLILVIALNIYRNRLGESPVNHQLKNLQDENKALILENKQLKKQNNQLKKQLDENL